MRPAWGRRYAAWVVSTSRVTPETKQRILDVLQDRWEASLLALRAQEEERLIALLPQMAETITQLRAVQQATAQQGAEIRAHLTPEHA